MPQQSRTERQPRERGLPFSDGKRGNHYTMKKHTAAKRKSSRLSRKKKTCHGRRSWMNAWPSLTTQKGGKNAGRAPRYSDRAYER